MTIPDPKHSGAEERLITIGYSAEHRLLVVVHTEEMTISELFQRERQHPMKEKLTNQSTSEQDDVDMLDEYDFSGGVRGKYAERYHADKNLIRLDPDVAKVFPITHLPKTAD